MEDDGGGGGGGDGIHIAALRSFFSSKMKLQISFGWENIVPTFRLFIP